MPRKAGSIADINLSLHARAGPDSTRHQGRTLLSRKLVCLRRYTPLSARSIGSFPVSRLPLGRAA